MKEGKPGIAQLFMEAAGRKKKHEEVLKKALQEFKDFKIVTFCDVDSLSH